MNQDSFRFFLNLNLLFLKKISKKFWLPALVVLIVILGAGIFFGQKIFSPKQDTASDVSSLVSEVGKLVALPDETPTVATITDITKLANQPFFQKAKNGDKVLIYAQAKKAYLYDPNAKKVIDVAPINLGTPSAEEASPSGTPR